MNEVLPKDWNAKTRPADVVLVSSDVETSDVELGFLGSAWYEVLSRPEVFGSFLVLGLIAGFFCVQIFSEFAIFVVGLGVALAVSILLMMLYEWGENDELAFAPPYSNGRSNQEGEDMYSYTDRLRYSSIIFDRD